MFCWPCRVSMSTLVFRTAFGIFGYTNEYYKYVWVVLVYNQNVGKEQVLGHIFLLFMFFRVTFLFLHTSIWSPCSSSLRWCTDCGVKTTTGFPQFADKVGGFAGDRLEARCDLQHISEWRSSLRSCVTTSSVAKSNMRTCRSRGASLSPFPGVFHVSFHIRLWQRSVFYAFLIANSLISMCSCSVEFCH